MHVTKILPGNLLKFLLASVVAVTTTANLIINSHFTVFPNVKPTLESFRTTTVTSRIECLAVCAQTLDCEGVFLTHARNCDLYDVYAMTRLVWNTNGSLLQKVPLKQMDLLLPVTGANCSSSTFRDEWGPNGKHCGLAYDGDTSRGAEWMSKAEDSGLWMRIVFPRDIFILKAVMWFRCFRYDQNSRLWFESDDGTTLEWTRTCTGVLITADIDCSMEPGEDIPLWFPGKTTSLNITLLDDCLESPIIDDNAGIREIQLWGFY